MFALSISMRIVLDIRQDALRARVMEVLELVDLSHDDQGVPSSETTVLITDDWSASSAEPSEYRVRLGLDIVLPGQEVALIHMLEQMQRKPAHDVYIYCGVRGGVGTTRAALLELSETDNPNAVFLDFTDDPTSRIHIAEHDPQVTVIAWPDSEHNEGVCTGNGSAELSGQAGSSESLGFSELSGRAGSSESSGWSGDLVTTRLPRGRVAVLGTKAQAPPAVATTAGLVAALSSVGTVIVDAGRWCADVADWVKNLRDKPHNLPVHVLLVGRTDATRYQVQAAQARVEQRNLSGCVTWLDKKEMRKRKRRARRKPAGKGGAGGRG